MPRGDDAPADRVGFAEFVALIAGMMALTALSIDAMLPALPAIVADLEPGNANDRQFVVLSYLVGFSVGQLVYGPLSDSLGRKPTLYVGLAIYAVGAAAAAFAPAFAALIAARVVQGLGGAAARIIAVAIVRDRFAGREMSRVMSFVMMIFVVVPVIAPTLGAGVLLVAPWRAIFLALLVAVSAVAVWAALRLPETRPPEKRAPLSVRPVASAFATVLRNRMTLGYMIGLGFLFGILMSYVSASEQIFAEVYDVRALFPLLFGASASVLILGSLTNARLVGRLGMRRMSRIGLAGQGACCAVVLLAGAPAHPPLWAFLAFICVMFFFFNLIIPNFNALAMEPLGEVAGTASSVLGFYSTGAAAVFGGMVAQSFDGTVRPFFIGCAGLVAATAVTVFAFDRTPPGPRLETPPAAAKP